MSAEELGEQADVNDMFDRVQALGGPNAAPSLPSPPFACRPDSSMHALPLGELGVSRKRLSGGVGRAVRVDHPTLKSFQNEWLGCVLGKDVAKRAAESRQDVLALEHVVRFKLPDVTERRYTGLESGRVTRYEVQ